MKRFLTAALLIAVLASSLLLTSCGQEEINNFYNETKANVAQFCEPFFKKFEKTEDAEGTEDTEDTEDSGDGLSDKENEE